MFDTQPSGALLDRRDLQVSNLMAQYYEQARKLLIDNRAKLDLITARLLEDKTLLGEQLQELLKCA